MSLFTGVFTWSLLVDYCDDVYVDNSVINIPRTETFDSYGIFWIQMGNFDSY